MAGDPREPGGGLPRDPTRELRQLREIGDIREVGELRGGIGGSGGSDENERQRRGGVAEKTRRRAAKPPRFKVVLYNDDYTPMGFVVGLLETVFKKSPVEANALMLRIHRSGSGVAGVYGLEIAETKVATVHRMAEARGHPLRAGVETE